MNNKDIDPIDSNNRFHGYQQWNYSGKLLLRGKFIHGRNIGYTEYHGNTHNNNKKCIFFIK